MPDARPAPADWVVVAAGGAVGAGLRHAVSAALPLDPVGVGTVVANVVGAFALGVLVARAVEGRAGLFWRTGVLGAFTTFSSMAVDAVGLGPVAGTTYLIGLVGTGTLAAWLGLRVGASR